MSSTKQQGSLKRLLRYARPHRKQVYLATTYSILNKIFDIAPPALIGAAVDIVVQKENSLFARMGMVDVYHQLYLLAFLTFLVWGFESIFEYLYAWQWRNLAQTIQHDLRLDAYSHIQGLEMAYFEDQSTGGLMSILNDDINQLERFLDGGANDIIQVTTTVIVISISFFAFSPMVALVSILPMPFVLWGSFAFQKKIAPHYADVREKVGFLSGQLVNNLSGIETIKSFTAEDYEKERIRRLSEEYRQSNLKAISLSAAFAPLIRMVIVVGFTATLILGGWLALSGGLNVGAYSVMIFLTQRLLWPLTRLGSTFDLFQRAMASTKRILNLLDTPIQIQAGQKSLAKEKIKGELLFKDISFHYQDRERILTDFQLHLPAGKTIAIVGPTGSGKSTIIKLLMRLYDPQEGSIQLDQHLINQLNFRDLRNAIGLVSQQVFLFHGSVRENIAYGSFDATNEEIEKAAKVAEAHQFIQELPSGYDTLVGERGQKLSGGQRQRLSLARAVLKDPPVLVLDEATSAVDNETEAAIQRSLEKVTKDRSTLIIAHRLSTIRHADQIIVLEKGKIVESGKHEELIRNNHLYTRLWQVQTGEQELT